MNNMMLDIWMAVHTPEPSECEAGGTICIVAARGEARVRKIFDERFPGRENPRVASIQEVFAMGMLDHFLPTGFIEALSNGMNGETYFVSETYIDLRGELQ